MIRQLTFLLLLLGVLFALGCASGRDGSAAATTPVTGGEAAEKPLDFAALTAAIDEGIGRRFQTMQMEAIQSATYGYAGSLETVIKIVDPIARASGFRVMEDVPSPEMGEAEQELHDKMGLNMQTTEQKFYTHANGNMITLMRMDLASDGMNMNMLIVQMMNPQEMGEIYAEDDHQPLAASVVTLIQEDNAQQLAEKLNMTADQARVFLNLVDSTFGTVHSLGETIEPLHNVRLVSHYLGADHPDSIQDKYYALVVDNYDQAVLQLQIAASNGEITQIRIMARARDQD